MIDITSIDFSMTESIRQEIEDLKSSIGRYLGDSERVHVTLSKSSPTVFKVHFHALYRGKSIDSFHESHNFHKAVELSKDHFVRQLAKRKDVA